MVFEVQGASAGLEHMTVLRLPYMSVLLPCSAGLLSGMLTGIGRFQPLCFHFLCGINNRCVELVIRKFYLFLLVLSGQCESIGQKYSWMQFLRYHTPKSLESQGFFFGAFGIVLLFVCFVCSLWF